MRRRRFAEAQVEERGDGGGVQDISRVDERFRRRVGELGEAGGGLLRGDKGADRVDVQIFVEIGEWQRERVIGGSRSQCTAFTDSTRETNAFQGSDTHHCKRQHLGYPGTP